MGAGAVLAVLPGSRSPEAEVAVAAFCDARLSLRTRLAECSSGRELVDAGYESDVEIAAEFDVSGAVPILEQGRFVDERGATYPSSYPSASTGQR